MASEINSNNKNPNTKIFSLNRIKYSELWNDAVNWIKATYQAASEKFTSASPFSQLLSVILHMSRMIFYYIEDSITGLNIKTAYRPDQIRGLATLTGHVPGRAIGARGAIEISYYNNINNVSNNYSGQICYIPNKLSVTNKLNGFKYIVLFSADSVKMKMTENSINKVSANIIQGTLKYQQATSTGEELQSFNFTERNHAEIDEYYVNIYVNGEQWQTVSSLLDLGYNQKGVVVKTGMYDGIDVFFGNTDMGAIPGNGAIIMIEYIITEGITSNLPKSYVNSDIYWEFNDYGYLSDGTQVDLNNNFKITCLTDIIFGTASENITLTQQLAPHVSRSLVLANTINYKYFLAKLNMFSVIEVFTGFKTLNNVSAQQKYNIAYSEYSAASDKYTNLVTLYGENSTQAINQYAIVTEKLNAFNSAQEYIDDINLNDNAIYMMLVPDITKRISTTVNYFTCDEDVFSLSTDEKNSLLNLIEMSGQKVLTVENIIKDLKMPRFAINVEAKIWNNYDEAEIYGDCLSKISDYLISNQRSTMIPISDLIGILEKISGINSVKVSFAADVENQYLYGQNGFYGIDDFGDIVLTREVTNNLGEVKELHDLYPLFRGGFTDPNGVQYDKEQSEYGVSAFNFTVTEKTEKSIINTENLTSIN